MTDKARHIGRQEIKFGVSLFVLTTLFSNTAQAHEKALSLHVPVPVHNSSSATVDANHFAAAALNTPLAYRIASNSPLPVAQGGQWSAPQGWPVLAVHANLLPTGKVLAWDATPDDFDEDPHTTENYTTRVTLWDPLTNSHTQTNNDTDTDLFCAGSSHMWDGRVLFAGGDSEREGRNGPLSNTNLYDPWTNTWERADNMNAARWYSSVAALPNGEMLTMGGSYSPNPLGEVFPLSQRWRSLALTPPYSLSGDYQWIQSGPDGSVLYFGPHDLISTIRTENSGSWEVNTVRDGLGYRGYGSYAMYDVGKILVAGGGDSLNSSVIVDARSKVATGTGSMTHGRRQHNLTILADGSVLATGGNHSGSDLVDLYSGVFTPEIWDPQTGNWRAVNDMQIDRQYHSVALLLPDGRVLSAGGGYCGICSSLAYHEQNAEIYSPPYLFDRNGNPAQRPKIAWAPAEVNYGSSFVVNLDSSNAISKVHLVKLGSVTHSENQDQRLIPIQHEQRGSELRLTAPALRNDAPPGHYMLFVLENGVPSHAHMLKLGQPLLKGGEFVRNQIRSGERHEFAFQPAAGQDLLSINLSGLTGDLDLLANIGTPVDASQTDSTLACASRSTGSTSESCSIVLSGQDTVYISVLASASSSYNLLLGNTNVSEADIELPFADNPKVQDLEYTPISAQLIPTAPPNLRGEVYSANSVEVFWDASIDNNAVQGYEVYRNGRLLERIDARSLYQTDLQADTQYTFAVLAFDNENNKSPLSNEVTLRTFGSAGVAQAAEKQTPMAAELPAQTTPAAPEPAPEPTPVNTPAPVEPVPEPTPEPAPTPITPEPEPEPAPEPAPPPEPEPAQKQNLIFALIDADSDMQIYEYSDLKEGDRISQARLPSRQLSIQADVRNIKGITRVQFDFDGIRNIQTEGVAPYSLFGDRGSDYIGMPMKKGKHTVTARVYVGNKQATSRSVSFYIED